MSSTNEDEPQLINDLDNLELDNPRYNYKLYKKVLQYIKQKELISNYKDSPIYYTNEYDKHKIYCLDLENKTVVYFMEYEIQSCDFINQDWATQVLVWRGGGEKYIEMTSYILFDILLPKVKLVMSDSQQTNKGKDLWERFIRYSFERKYNIYFVNFNDKTITLLSSYQNYINFRNRFKPWKNTEINKNYRFVVSQNNLTIL